VEAEMAADEAATALSPIDPAMHAFFVDYLTTKWKLPASTAASARIRKASCRINLTVCGEILPAYNNAKAPFGAAEIIPAKPPRGKLGGARARFSAGG